MEEKKQLEILIIEDNVNHLEEAKNEIQRRIDSELNIASSDQAKKSALKSIWTELKNAIRGSDADYTKINLGKAIFLLAVPMILELIMESTFAVVDIYFVGTLGASAVAS